MLKVQFPQLVQKLHGLRAATPVKVVDLEKRSVVGGPTPLETLAQRGFANAVGASDAAVLLVRPAAPCAGARQQRCGAGVPRVANAP